MDVFQDCENQVEFLIVLGHMPLPYKHGLTDMLYQYNSNYVYSATTFIHVMILCT